MVQHCCIVGCGATSNKCRGLTFHCVKRDDKEWQKKLVRAVNRSDKGFNQEKAKICSRHFSPNCFETDSEDFDFDHTIKRKLKGGSLPTLAMPERTHTRKVPPRKAPAHRHVEQATEGTFDGYIDPEQPENDHGQDDFMPPGWTKIGDDLIRYLNLKVTHCIRQNQTLSFYLDGRPVQFESTGQSLGEIATSFEKLVACPGIVDKPLQHLKRNPDFHKEMWLQEGRQRSLIRSNLCRGIGPALCKACKRVEKCLVRRQRRSNSMSQRNLANKAPLSRASKAKLIQAVRLARQEKKVKGKKTDDVEVDEKVHNGLMEIMKNAPQDGMDPLLKTFWEDQVKNLGRQGTGRRWNPAVIRFALLIHAQSPQAYHSLRSSGLLTLPGEATLRDYSNVLSPNQGFQHDVIEEIRKSIVKLKLEDNQRYVTLMFDEMRIQKDLVFSQRSGALVGFSHNSSQVVATHVLVFMVGGLTYPLKFSLGHFGTAGYSSAILYALFWKAVYYIECAIGLKVLATTADKAGANMKFFSMMGGISVENMFAQEKRSIYFISDAPHLVKTLRNNLSSSGSGRNTRYMWNNGKHLLWEYVRQVYLNDQNRELRLTKLTQEHVFLNSYSVMRVPLAVQVLSSSVANAMETYGPSEASETVRFIRLVDRFFDCLNVRSQSEGHRVRKPDRLPYTSVDDPRLEFLENEFLQYFNDWQQAVANRVGYSGQERSAMFLSSQTYEGLTTTVKSTCAVIRFLLDAGVAEVYTARLSQDSLESHFGRHRGMARRSDNPTLLTFGYQENTLRIQRNVAIEMDKNCLSSSPLKKLKRTK